LRLTPSLRHSRRPRLSTGTYMSNAISLQRVTPTIIRAGAGTAYLSALALLGEGPDGQVIRQGG